MQVSHSPPAEGLAGDSNPSNMGHAKKKEILGGFPLNRSSSSISMICFNSKTAIKVLPEPNGGQLCRRRGKNFDCKPVSRTAIVFCILALSKSSSWYSLGSVMIFDESCFDMSARMDNVASSAFSITVCTSLLVNLAVRFDTLHS